MCARDEPPIPSGSDYLSRDNVAADDNKQSRNMGDHSRTTRYGYPRPRRIVCRRRQMWGGPLVRFDIYNRISLFLEGSLEDTPGFGIGSVRTIA